jgi:hypothetical protein
VSDTITEKKTKNQPEPSQVDDSAQMRKARRTVRLKDDFKSAIKNKKAAWVLTSDENALYAVSFLEWKLSDKKVEMFIRDYETVEEASHTFDRAKSPFSSSVGRGTIPQEGFGDESFMKDADYVAKGKRMNLTFRSGNYLVSLTGAKDDIFSFGKIISDTINEKKKSVSELRENQ